jgi:hypothetical protein
MGEGNGVKGMGQDGAVSIYHAISPAEEKEAKEERGMF